MPQPSLNKEELVFHKIHFIIRKKVRFGQAVYVCGSIPQLGFWSPQRAFRLNWNEGNLWTGIVSLTSNIPPKIEYKYVIANWDSPSQEDCQWQLGEHNRQADLNRLKPITICGKGEIMLDGNWNFDHVSLILLKKKSKSPQDEGFYVTGNIRELGQWHQKKSMKKNLTRIISSQIKNHSQIISENFNKQYQIWTFSFSVFRSRSQFYYYYIKKGEILERERKPGRIFEFNKAQKAYPNRRSVIHPRGDIVIIDEINLNQINISKITPHIFVGSYLRSALDLQKLKQNNVTAVFSIQSEKDFKKNSVSPHYLKILCQQYQIKHKAYSIEDMNNKDFVIKAERGVQILANLLSSGQKVYVHCSAGIYRSPQMIALYLAAFQQYRVQDAVTLLKQKHPYAKPSFKVVEQSLTLIRTKKMVKIRV